MPSFARLAAIILLGAIAFPAALRAQVSGGTLSGTIADPSGRAIPQAQVVIVNIATGVARTVTTNADGFYTAVNLLAGDYKVTISAKGFNTEAKTGITMNVGAQQTLDLTLQVGTVTHTVQVTYGSARGPGILFRNQRHRQRYDSSRVASQWTQLD